MVSEVNAGLRRRLAGIGRLRDGWLARAGLAIVGVWLTVGCELVVNFDRSRLVDPPREAGLPGEEEAGLPDLDGGQLVDAAPLDAAEPDAARDAAGSSDAGTADAGEDAGSALDGATGVSDAAAPRDAEPPGADAAGLDAG